MRIGHEGIHTTAVHTRLHDQKVPDGMLGSSSIPDSFWNMDNIWDVSHLCPFKRILDPRAQREMFEPRRYVVVSYSVVANLALPDHSQHRRSC